MTLVEIYTTVSNRLNEAAAPIFYPTLEIVAAINEGQRLFALLTLCLERTATWNIAANTTFFHMLALFADWIAPLRFTLPSGQKLRPSRLGELWSLDSQWVASPGAPYRYAAMGADLVAVYQQPTVITAVEAKYAGSPAALVLDADVPEIAPEYHEQLVKFGIYRCRQVEGGEEFAKVLPLLAEFLDAAEAYGNYIRARNRGAGYDTLPMELASVDRSRLVGTSK